MTGIKDAAESEKKGFHLTYINPKKVFQYSQIKLYSKIIGLKESTHICCTSCLHCRLNILGQF